MQLQAKLQKTAGKTYLKANKQQTRYRLTYLEVSKEEKRYDWCFEGETTAWKVNCYAFRGYKQKNKVCFV